MASITAHPARVGAPGKHAEPRRTRRSVPLRDSASPRDESSLVLRAKLFARADARRMGGRVKPGHGDFGIGESEASA